MREGQKFLSILSVIILLLVDLFASVDPETSGKNSQLSSWKIRS